MTKSSIAQHIKMAKSADTERKTDGDAIMKAVYSNEMVGSSFYCKQVELDESEVRMS